jgi:hypothetical protein
MGDMFEIGPAQRRYMREASAALLTMRPEPPGSPYYVPSPCRPVARPSVVPAPVEAVAEPKRSALDEATAWLELALTPDGLTALEVKERASEASIAPRTLRRASERLRVVKTKQGVGGWHWSLPEQPGQE